MEGDIDPAIFNIDNWPVSTLPAMAMLKNIVDDYAVSPLRAYHADGSLIYPEDYQQSLQGSLVWAEVALDHWTVDSEHFFQAAVHRLRVISSPQCFVPISLPPLCSHDPTPLNS